jgi:D-alanine-D-alanine ligase
MRNRKPHLAVFFGGQTGSQDLSEESGYWACQYIPRSLYQVTPIRVAPDGRWQVPLGSLPQQGPIQRMMTKMFEAVPIVSATKGLERLLRRPVDLLLTLVRGVGGDDGSLQGVGRTLSIPVIGSSLPVCQQTSDKFTCAQRVSGIITSPETQRFKQGADSEHIVEAVRRLYVPPLFVKPVYEEASVGVEEVNSIDELGAAVRRAQQAGDVIVQKKALGTEMTVTLFNDQRGQIQALPPTVIVPQKVSFYDHLAKRRAGRVALNTQAVRNNAILKRVQAVARDIYEDVGCDGIVSFDVNVDGADIKLLEINTVPTLTTLTPLFQQLKIGRVHPTTLFEQQIARSLERVN